MLTDPIADMLTRIRNANICKAEKVDIPYSKFKEKIIQIFKREGFIKNYKLLQYSAKAILRVYLRYGFKEERMIIHLERISKPGLRKYLSYKEFSKQLKGLGKLIVSTSKGVMTDKEAKRLKLGGEVVCQIW